MRSIPLPRAATLRLDTRLLALPYAAWVALALGFGFVVRLRPFVGTDWPINDGGLFVAAVQAIWDSGYALPATLPYNGVAIPFAYPPLAFYAAALLGDLGRAPLSEVLRILPLAFSWLSVVGFQRLARRLLLSDAAVVAATFAFALAPSGWIWMVMGGGLTRALGLAMSLFALASILDVLARPSRRGILVAGALSACTLLAHVEYAWALAFSAAVLALADPARRKPGTLAAIGLVAAAISSPWWVAVLLRHGPAPFLAASQTGQLVNPLEQLLAFRQSAEPNFPLFAALALFGALIAFVRREHAVLLWLAAIALLDPRSWGTLSTPPLAVLAARGAVDGVLPLLRGRRVVAVTFAAIAVAYVTHGSLISSAPLLSALTPDERAAMGWVAANTPPDARVAVLSERGWAEDRQAEWFPLLAGRVSVSTAQGLEWLPRGEFRRRLLAIEALEQCGSQDGACLEAWSSDYGVAYDVLFLPKYQAGIRLDRSDTWCCMSVRNALRSDPRFRLVYDGPGATIFERSERLP